MLAAVRTLLLLVSLTVVSIACDCAKPPLVVAEDRASIVFKGVVTKIDRLASDRVTVGFTVLVVWKGPLLPEIILHQGRHGDCSDFEFAVGGEYLVFAKERRVTNSVTSIAKGEAIAPEWLGLLPVGGRILSSGLCSGTGDVAGSVGFLKGLGMGERRVGRKSK